MKHNLGDVMASSLQFWNQLENRKSENNKMSRGVWKTVETKAEKIRVVEAKRGKNNGSKEGSRKI